MQNCKFYNNKSFLQDAGGIYLKDISIPSQFLNLDFDSNYSSNSGGDIFAYNIQNSIIQNLKSNNSTALTHGGFLFFNGLNKNITFDQINLNNSFSGQSGSFCIFEGKEFNINNVQINNSTATKGAGLYLQVLFNTNIKNVNIQNSQAKTIGGMIIDRSKFIDFQGLNITNCNVQTKFGAIFVHGSQFIQLDQVILKNNIAGIYCGGLGIFMTANTNFTNFQIQNNSAQINGGGVFMQNNENVLFENLFMKDNYAMSQGGGMNFIYLIGALFKNITIISNKANNNKGGGIFMQSSVDIVFQQAIFQDNQAMIGAGFYCSSINSIQLYDVQFITNQAQISGGGFYTEQSIDIVMHNINFLQNESKQQGAGVAMFQAHNVTITDNYFNNNRASEGYGGGIFISDKSIQIHLNNVIFSQNFAYKYGGAIIVEYTDDINLNDIQFQQNYAGLKGSAIYIKYNEKIVIDNSLFTSQKQSLKNTEQGSCVYSENNKIITIKNSKITDNQSQFQGGAIYLYDSQQITIQNNNISNNNLTDTNYIDSKGGAIYINNSNLLNILNNIINNNESTQQGGSIYIKYVEQIIIQNNTLSNSKVLFNNSTQLIDKDFQYQTTQGGAIYIEYNYKNIQQGIQIKDNIFSQNYASSGGAVMLNYNNNTSIVTKINNNTFIQNQADIGPSIRIIGTIDTFIVQLLQLNIQQNNQLDKNKGIIHDDDIYIGYYTNEKLQQKNFAQFKLCEQGQHQQGGNFLCDQCDPNGDCKGGYIPMYPKQGYWRFDNQQTEIFYCVKNPDACLGEDTCKEGHIGLLCENCDLMNNYSKSGKDCVKCANKGIIIFSVFAFFFISCILLANQLYGLNNKINRKLLQNCFQKLYDLCFQKISSIAGAIKIFFMHSQILYLLSSSNIQLPSEITETFTFIGNPQQMFSNSLSCLIQPSSLPEIMANKYNLQFYGLILTFFTLLFLILIQVLFFVFKKYIKQKQQLISHIYGSILCFFLMIQPGILQNSLQFIMCNKLGNYRYSQADSNISCDTDFYKNIVFPISLIIIILLVIVIPTFQSLVLYKKYKNNQLSNLQTQRKYGILYLEVKQQYFYWEIITMTTKILCVLVIIIFEQDIIIQGALLFLLLFTYLIMNCILQPYNTKKLFNLANLSLVTLILSVLLIMLVEQLKTNESSDIQTILIVPYIIIVGLNITFVSKVVIIAIDDFQWKIRSLTLQYMKNDNIFVLKLKKQIEKEKQAKQRWKCIRIGIHLFIKSQRRLKEQKIPHNFLNSDVGITIYVKYVFKNNDCNYFSDIKLDDQIQEKSFQQLQKMSVNLDSSFQKNLQLISPKQNPSCNNTLKMDNKQLQQQQNSIYCYDNYKAKDQNLDIDEIKTQIVQNDKQIIESKQDLTRTRNETSNLFNQSIIRGDINSDILFDQQANFTPQDSYINSPLPFKSQFQQKKKITQTKFNY